MGVSLKDLVVKKDISIADLKGKVLVVDGFNVLYQFLATIRQMDGTPLKDSHGNITSHLSGLFRRTTKLMKSGLKLVFVFDGVAPELKERERERRAAIKQDAQVKHDQAAKQGDIDGMKKYAMRTSRLSPDMVEEAKILLSALGLPVVQAPSEGEAQAAHMVTRGDIFAEISQDYDCLLFNVPRMIQNLTISERKKKKDRLSYETVKPQMIDLTENLKLLGLTHDQLIILGILIGTDFNVGGIKGIGPKKALQLVKQYQNDFESLFREVKWGDHFDFEWTAVFDLIKNMPVTDDYELVWNSIDQERVLDILVARHDFSEVRVKDTLDKLKKEQSQLSQKGLGDFC